MHIWAWMARSTQLRGQPGGSDYRLDCIKEGAWKLPCECKAHSYSHQKYPKNRRKLRPPAVERHQHLRNLFELNLNKRMKVVAALAFVLGLLALACGSIYLHNPR